MTNDTWLDFDKVKQMVNAHEIQFGKKPLEINIPQPEIKVFGVKVNFIKHNSYFTADLEHCLHHHFQEYK